MKQKLVIVGNGMAPGRALDLLFETAPDAYEVTIFNAEPRVNYDRIMLSPVLSGEKSFEEIVIHGDGWYIKHGVTLYKGAKVDRRSTAQPSRTPSLRLGTGQLRASQRSPCLRPADHRHRLERHHHSGARPRPARRASPTAISTTWRPCCWPPSRAAMRWSSAAACSGLEAAAGLQAQGMDVTVVHLMPTLMERQLDPAAGHLLQRAIEARGIKRHHQGQHQSDRRRRQGARPSSSTTARMLPARSRGDGGRHPAQHRARQGRRPDGQPRHRRRRDHAHVRSGHLRGRANASRPTARCSAWSRRSTRWRASWPPSSPAMPPRASRRPPPRPS